MEWKTFVPIATLIVLYIGGILGIATFINSTLGARIDDARGDIKELRSSMETEFDQLSDKINDIKVDVERHLAQHEVREASSP